ncbi:Glycosidase [Saccharicrinis carchari]|uniref:Glycosidase n=1 Tax=Saccharicrinis carchari TaxID=1168039 RepID=A0A521D686_SACCC|nr:glycoside hydrolase family 13 protein [Saccharicrinis carchari]SMO67199.1 Glycosidase [Saccharicrinis carchari]
MLPNNTTQKKQSPIHRIEPGNWWIGMKSSALQLLVYGPQITHARVSIDYPGISLQKLTKVENPNYLFIDLLIDDAAQAGNVPLNFTIKGVHICTYDYPLLNREPHSAVRKGFDSGDAIYLIMPDRFANGNPSSNHVDGMREIADRAAPYGRHGGDLQGILSHLDYIQEMGYTALWLTPVLENNQPSASYHGYAITDFYKIDARLGSNEEFKLLTRECNKRGIKMIMDMVFNHCGSHHWWMNDLPMFSWVNQWPEFTRSNNRLGIISDPYASDADKQLLVKGWFDTAMPDLNLENPLLLTYLIQNSIWWIEYAGLQGIRMDTYPYPDKRSMAIWAKRILNEYPNFNLVGECWINEAAKLCYWQKDFPGKGGYNSHLPSLMDFPLQEAIKYAFNEAEGWTTGMARLYNALANDHLYPKPMNLMVFADNHDEGRIFHLLGNDIAKLKMALTYAATIRGILQIYYGTELLMDGNGWDGHDKIRLDFPGGWDSDTVNAFTLKGRTREQNNIFNHIKKLLNYRKQSEALKYGKTLHFIPEEGIYVYFRYTDNQTVMVILNNNTKGSKKVHSMRFREVMGGFTHGTNIISGRKLIDLKNINTKAKTAMVLELK